jgi:hypothetical protein
LIVSFYINLAISVDDKTHSPDRNGILFCYCDSGEVLLMVSLLRNDKKDIVDSGIKLLKNFDKMGKTENKKPFKVRILKG